MRYFVIGGVTENHPKPEDEKKCLKNVCVALGQALSECGHSLVICSPYKDSADYWAISGFIKNEVKDNNAIEIHFVDSESIRAEVFNLESSCKPHRIVKIPYSEPNDNKPESLSYAWLLCQLQALETCHAVIAIGGRLNGAANMLLLLAEAKGKQVIPYAFMDGAAGQAFQRRWYELNDRLGDEFILLQDEAGIKDVLKISERMDAYQAKSSLSKESMKFFISYPKARPAEADYVETLLRRRDLKVFRDETDFGAGSEIPNKISEAIHRSNIFIAIWCAEYACSPWCFDEFELALDLHNSRKMILWILCVDETRLVPTRARNLKFYNVNTREDIEGKILKLLQQL